MANILVVEPSPVFLDLLRKFCTEEMHMTCWTAHNGQEALQILSQNAPNIVLSEIELPDVNGLDLVRRIQKKNCAVPVALMANDKAGYTQEDALKSGAKEFFSRPLALMKLKIELLRLLSAKAAR